MAYLWLQGCSGATAGSCQVCFGGAGGGALLRLPVSRHAPLHTPGQPDSLEGKPPPPILCVPLGAYVITETLLFVEMLTFVTAL